MPQHPELPDRPAPTDRQLLELRTSAENLASSTLTLLQQLRDLDHLPTRIRNQMRLVANDGGLTDLAISSAFGCLPEEMLQARQELRRGLIEATIVNTDSPAEAARLLTAPPTDAQLIELGDLALARIVQDDASADRLADLLDERTGMSSRDVDPAPEVIA